MTDGYLGDQFDAFGGESGPPVPSWDTLGKGGKVRGVIVAQPHPDNGQPLSYLTTQQTSMPTDEKPVPEPLFYDNDPNGGTFHKRPRLQAEFHIMVEPNDFADCSERYQAFAKENEVEDTGLRRLIVKGATASKAMQANGRKTFGGKGIPPLGAIIEQELLGKRPKGSFKENVFDVRFERPTADSLRVVQVHMSENFPESGVGGDAFSGGGSLASEPGSGSKSDDDPDF